MSTTYTINEGSTGKLSGVLKDESGTVLPAVQCASLTATLFDKTTGTVINSRNNQDILNANGGTLDANGNFALVLDGSDNAIVGVPGIAASEYHLLLIRWTYESGAKSGSQLFTIAVNNLAKVP